MNDDLNTPMVISYLSEATRFINAVYTESAKINPDDIKELDNVFNLFLFDILGLKHESEISALNEFKYRQAIDLLLQICQKAKEQKDWVTSDLIRDQLSEIGFTIKDTKEGTKWKIK